MGFGGTTLSRRGWAEIIAEEAHALGLSITPRQLAEGLGVREAEGNAQEGEHIGPWALSSAFAHGSTSGRLSYRESTRAALQNWSENGKSWWPAWGKWETGETEGAGPTRYKRHLALATAVLARHAVTSSPPAAARRRTRSTSTAATGAAPGGSSSGGIAGDFMHFGLVAVLVAGGVGMMGLGTTRLFHSGRAA